jgi:hypothetical protein
MKPAAQRLFSYLWAGAGTLLLVAAAFMFYVWTEKRIDHANELRYASRNLVEELRQSSDDLTRMARTYVATGEPSTATTTRKSSTSATAARRAPAIMRTSTGTWCWPPASARAAAAVPLMQLMREAGLAPEELALLAAAKNESDKLTMVEIAAMNLRAPAATRSAPAACCTTAPTIRPKPPSCGRLRKSMSASTGAPASRSLKPRWTPTWHAPPSAQHRAAGADGLAQQAPAGCGTQ